MLEKLPIPEKNTKELEYEELIKLQINSNRGLKYNIIRTLFIQERNE